MIHSKFARGFLRSAVLSIALPLILALPARAADGPDRTQPLAALDEVPEGLARSDWSSIRTAHEAWRHSFQRLEDGEYTARNPGQQWRTRVDGRGFLTTPDGGGWQWGLELRSYGYSGQGQRMADGTHRALAVEGQRLTRSWDDTVEEWYVNDQRGFEHGFTLTQRPAGAGGGAPLTIELTVRGGLRPQVQSGGQSVASSKRVDVQR